MSEKNDPENTLAVRPLLAGNGLLLRFVKLRVAFGYVSTFMFRLVNVSLLATINPLRLFQGLPEFPQFGSWRSFQFSSGTCKDFPASSLVAFSQFRCNNLTSRPKACGHFCHTHNYRLATAANVPRVYKITYSQPASPKMALSVVPKPKRPD